MKSLAGKLTLSIGIASALLATYLFYETYRMTNQRIEDVVVQQAEMALQFDLSIRSYVGGVVRPMMYEWLGEDQFVPETMLIHNILNALTKKRKSMAVVLDEYGGTSGILTVEDIIEELFGEIEDEHDSTDLFEEQLSENTYKFSARLEVDYINEQYRLELPESDEYGTLGGMIVNQTGDIPAQDTEIRIGHFLFRILEVSNTKIDLVTLEILDSD